MNKFTIFVGALLSLQLLMRGFRLQKLPVPRLVISLVLLAAAHWIGSTALYAAVGVLASWFVSSELGAMVDPLRDIRKGLASGDPAKLDGAIREAQEMGTEKAQAMLMGHLATQATGEDRKSTLVVLHALVESWGVDGILKHWEFLPAKAREGCLEALMGKTGFPVEALLRISRHGMDDEEAVAAAGWRTYASIVTAGFEGQHGEFDAQAWLQQSATDGNKDVQGLRSHLEQKRFSEVQTQGVDSLVSRYRREVFIQASSAAVQLRTSSEYELDGGERGTLRLPNGEYTGALSGKFDNAQNAMAEGWRFHLQLDDVSGEVWKVSTTWFSAEFFGEILDERHSANRAWYEEAPAELERAFATRAFVGPVVAYGDTWNTHRPTIDGDLLVLGEKQLLKCLIAIAPSETGEGTHLAFLLYSVEDGANEGDELRPFVTIIPLERWLLQAAQDEVTDLPMVQVE